MGRVRFNGSGCSFQGWVKKMKFNCENGGIAGLINYLMTVTG